MATSQHLGSLRVVYLASPVVCASLVGDLKRAGAKSLDENLPQCLTLPNVLMRRFFFSESALVPEEHWSGSQVWFFENANEAAETLSQVDADLMIVDERAQSHDTGRKHQERPEKTVAPQVESSPPILFEDFEKALKLYVSSDFHFPTRRILAVIPEGPLAAERTFELGLANLRRVIIEPKSSVELFHFATHQLSSFRIAKTKTALCLAGGGLEGYLYALGVMTALEDFYLEKTNLDFDIYCGVSSGALMALSFAAGISTQDLVTQIAPKAASKGAAKSLLSPITPGVMFDFAGGEMVKRIWDLLRSVTQLQVSEILLRLQKVVPVGFFRGERLKEFVEDQLRAAGVEDKLSALKKELYVSVTDQDTGEHVVFGEEPWTDIKASQAVRASTALPPFYLPENIKGHWFTDGQLTSSSDFMTAIGKGARLVVLVDPMVPYRSQQPGSVLKHGGYFTTVQAIKSLVHTRAESFLRHAMDMHPDVDFVVFRPTDEVMTAMAGSPMKYQIRTELAELGYKVTLRQLLEGYETLSRRFAKHGIRVKAREQLLELEKAAPQKFS